MSDDAMGPDGYLAERGLIPLPEEKLKQVRKQASFTPLPMDSRLRRRQSTRRLAPRPRRVARSSDVSNEKCPPPAHRSARPRRVLARPGRALAKSDGSLARLHSLPHYYGYYVALWCGLPALASA